MALWIVWDSQTDWLTDVIEAENEFDAWNKASDDEDERIAWATITQLDEEGQQYTTIYVLRWDDTTVSAVDYYGANEHRASMVPVFHKEVEIV